MRIPLFILGTAALWLSTGPAMAQRGTTTVITPRAGARTVYRSDDDGDHDRAWLGISTGAGGRRDTLGLLIESIVPGSPAEKGGLEEGNRIASINGVNLKLDANDAGEPEMADMASRRLTREMRKLKPGDEVELRVYGAGQYRTLKIKTATADESEHVSLSSFREKLGNRAVLGVGLGSSGSKRDTLGVFVSSVTEGGPADKAGVVEGDRIASIDGTDLRVPREDAGDGMVGSARMSRLQRVLRDKKPGDEVALRLWSGGRWREVKVKATKASDMPGANNEYRFFTGDTPGGMMLRTPMPAMAPLSPSAIRKPRIELNGEPLQYELEAARAQVERAQQKLRMALPGTIAMPRAVLGRRSYTI